MKGFGYLFIFIGVAYLFFAFNMDVSVSSSSAYIPGIGSVGGGEIANLDLMARRQNHLIVAALITLIGALMVIFGGSRVESSQVAQLVKDTKPVADFSGERELSSDPYRLWLAAKYQIERNEIFDRFVLGEQTFANLDAVLAKAHAIEVLEAEERAAKAVERAARIAAHDEAMRMAAEEDAARWREQQPKVIVGAFLVVLLLVGAGLLLKESPAERAAREKADRDAQVELIAEAERKFDVKLPSDAVKVKLTAVNQSTAFRCDGIENGGEILEFSTRFKKEQVRDHFRKFLGKGQPQFEYLDDSFDWNWKKGQTKYLLTMFSDEVSNSVYLCIIADK
jgi:hypothetical protein